VGSVSGAQASATVGTPYDNGKVAFTIADGSTDFLVSDAFTFTTTQGAMKAAGQEWIYEGRASDQTDGGWVKGRGLAGTESIYVGLRSAIDAGNDIYSIEIGGAQGFNAAFGWASQVGKSPTTYVASWNSSVPYWIVASGRRFVVVSKVSTTYHAMYGGLILPYATPSQYPYPHFIGGHGASNLRWSDTSVGFRQFIDPGATSTATNTGANLCFPDGSWQYFSNFTNSSGNDSLNITTGRSIWPYAGGGSATHVDDRLREMRDNIDGTYTLLPLILSCESPSRQVFGEFDGCYWVSGYGNAAENIITVSGQDYLVVQNIFRTNRWNYWALKLA
jgi:hypothetical protein